MELFHFTCLKHLPKILREGISKGEVPTGPEIDVAKRPNAVNLTLVGDRGPQQDWNSGNVYDKTKVRLRVECPDETLRSFADIVRDYSVSPSWVERIDPLKQRSKWFFAFDEIAPSQICDVSVFDEPSGEYVSMVGKGIDELVQRIEAEAEKLEIVRMPNGATAVGLKDEYNDCWLLDGPRFRQDQEAEQRRKAEQIRQRQLDRKQKRQRKEKAKQKKRRRTR